MLEAGKQKGCPKVFKKKTKTFWQICLPAPQVLSILSFMQVYVPDGNFRISVFAKIYNSGKKEFHMHLYVSNSCNLS